jgi:hypothetical protein
LLSLFSWTISSVKIQVLQWLVLSLSFLILVRETLAFDIVLLRSWPRRLTLRMFLTKFQTLHSRCNLKENLRFSSESNIRCYWRVFSEFRMKVDYVPSWRLQREIHFKNWLEKPQRKGNHLIAFWNRGRFSISLWLKNNLLLSENR